MFLVGFRLGFQTDRAPERIGAADQLQQKAGQPSKVREGLNRSLTNVLITLFCQRGGDHRQRVKMLRVAANMNLMSRFPIFDQ